MRALAAVAFFLALSACTPGARVAGTEGRKIRVFYNNDNFAYLETCGCRVSPIGGMDRRWNAIKAVPDDSRLFLDSGNLLFKSANSSDFLAPQWYEQALGVVEAYNLLGADAVGVGETEFALGVDKFRELASKARFPFLSANLFVKATGQPLLPDSVTLERQGRRIGVFALFGPQLRLPSSLEARDPVETARRMVAKLRGAGAQMVVALTHQGYDADVQLARKVAGIDLIVGGHSQSLIQQPDEEGSTLIVQLSNQGQMLGMVEYEASSLPKVRTAFQVSELDHAFDEAPGGLANPMKSLVAVTNLRIQETNRRLDEKVWAESGAKAPAAGFETSIACRSCHAKQAEFHDGKPHSAAFLSLLAQGKESNLDCVKCHSVGLGQTGGFESLADAFRDANGRPIPLEHIRREAGLGFPKAGVNYREQAKRLQEDVAKWHQAMAKAQVRKSFVSVQCESCHGMVPGHPFREFQPAPVRITACVQCHTKEQAPTWYSKEGNLLEDKAQAALASMRCPK